MTLHSQDTIAAIATALGESALSLIRVSGPGAIDVVDKIFLPQSGKPLSSSPSHRIRVGRLSSGEETIDHAVVSLFRKPRSYTGEDVVEITTHGNPMIMRQILSVLFRNGARPAQPGEFTQRAYLNNRMDLAQAEAVAQLIRAKTEVARRVAMDQLEGRLSRVIQEFKNSVISLLAHIEVGLDHADDDQPFLSDEDLTAQVKELQDRLAQLMGTFRSGTALREGVKVAIVGKPNVGKSSLLNILLREDRALVTDIPGTTRDVLKEMLDLDGIPLILLDTAGLRHETQDTVEKLGMERTKAVLAQAQLVVSVFDTASPLTEDDSQVMSLVKEQMEKGVEGILVLNKKDLSPRLSASELIQAFRVTAEVIRLSARTGEGVAELEESLKKHALGAPQESVIVSSVRHQEALKTAAQALEDAWLQAQKGRPELVALELRETLNHLGAIGGETATEEILAAIFSNFCIGK